MIFDFCYQAYMVFRGHGKGGGSDEARVPTSKFISKSRSGQPTKQSSITATNSNASAYHSNISTLTHAEAGAISNATSKLPEDVQVTGVS